MKRLVDVNLVLVALSLVAGFSAGNGHDQSDQCELDHRAFGDCDALIVGELRSVSQNSVVVQHVNYLQGQGCSHHEDHSDAVVELSVDWGTVTCYNQSALVRGTVYLFCSQKERWKTHACHLSANQPLVTVPRAMLNASTSDHGADSVNNGMTADDHRLKKHAAVVVGDPGSKRQKRQMSSGQYQEYFHQLMFYSKVLFKKKCQCMYIV